MKDYLPFMKTLKTSPWWLSLRCEPWSVQPPPPCHAVLSRIRFPSTWLCFYHDWGRRFEIYGGMERKKKSSGGEGKGVDEMLLHQRLPGLWAGTIHKLELGLVLVFDLHLSISPDIPLVRTVPGQLLERQLIFHPRKEHMCLKVLPREVFRLSVSE